MAGTHTRREFLKLAGAGLSAAVYLPRFAKGAPLRKGKLISPDSKLRIACVGCGGKGRFDVEVVSGEEIVALCDVDDVLSEQTYAKYPDVPKYKDYRKMIEEMDDSIDAVMVSTPDHMHYAVGMTAMESGKHVFIQKPLACSIWETRQLVEAAERHEVMTVMGNQGHAKEGVRLVTEWLRAGLIGNVEEVHVWTRKLTNGRHRSELRGEAPVGEPVPETMDWDLWLGTAPLLPYSVEYAPRRWRGWWKLGNGALGDIGCHTMDAAFSALELGAPSAVTAETSGYNEYTFPDWSIITYEFPARGEMPPVKMVWYDGGKLPEVPPELEGRNFNEDCGYYMRGEDGVIYDPEEQCTSPRIIPESKRLECAANMPEKTIPRVPDGEPAREWVSACKGGPLPGSNFNYAGPLTEVVLLGNLAIRAEGKRIEWDAKRMRIPNAPELEPYLNPPHRSV